MDDPKESRRKRAGRELEEIPPVYALVLRKRNPAQLTSLPE
jgi:hypothetical protein